MKDPHHVLAVDLNALELAVDAGHTDGEGKGEIEAFKSYFGCVYCYRMLANQVVLVVTLDLRSGMTQRVCPSTLAALVYHLANAVVILGWTALRQRQCSVRPLISRTNKQGLDM